MMQLIPFVTIINTNFADVCSVIEERERVPAKGELFGYKSYVQGVNFSEKRLRTYRCVSAKFLGENQIKNCLNYSNSFAFIALWRGAAQSAHSIQVNQAGFFFAFILFCCIFRGQRLTLANRTNFSSDIACNAVRPAIKFSLACQYCALLCSFRPQLQREREVYTQTVICMQMSRLGSIIVQNSFFSL